MTRVDIIAHEALEQPLIDTLFPVPEGTHDPEGRSGRPYTLYRAVAGRGLSGTCSGDEVWPESNICFVMYIDDNQTMTIRSTLADLRRRFPKLGLAVFAQGGYHEWNDGVQGHV